MNLYCLDTKSQAELKKLSIWRARELNDDSNRARFILWENNLNKSSTTVVF